MTFDLFVQMEENLSAHFTDLNHLYTCFSRTPLVCVSAIDVCRERKTDPTDISKLFLRHIQKIEGNPHTCVPERLFPQLSIAASATQDNTIK